MSNKSRFIGQGVDILYTWNLLGGIFNEWAFIRLMRVVL